MTVGLKASAVDIVKDLRIGSPKRNGRLQAAGWEGFFPYYAGYPQAFAHDVLESARLEPGAIVLDPWNGSGTTTYAATHLGLVARGFDINPAMVIVARARLLAASEADSLRPLAASIIGHLRNTPELATVDDPLNLWFAPKTAALMRAIEREIRRTVVGDMTVTPVGIELGRISGTAATLYVALFAACRALTAPFRSSNPTWIRYPKGDEARVQATRTQVVRQFTDNVRGMAAALATKSTSLVARRQIEWDVSLVDTTTAAIDPESVDFILTSPPYCTRIDYTAATRVELAVLHPLLTGSAVDLARHMTGSTHVPRRQLAPLDDWGATCNAFLDAVRTHKSKASAGYYFNTHLDYFDKMSKSLTRLAAGLKVGGVAVLVVQDSYYKDVHNDLPTIISEMGAAAGLELARSEPFAWQRSMSRINPHTRTYARPSHATETVLCLVKH